MLCFLFWKALYIVSYEISLSSKNIIFCFKCLKNILLKDTRKSLKIFQWKSALINRKITVYLGRDLKKKIQRVSKMKLINLNAWYLSIINFILKISCNFIFLSFNIYYICILKLWYICIIISYRKLSLDQSICHKIQNILFFYLFEAVYNNEIW